MNWDPLSREGAPPRYQVESGSEDEGDEAPSQKQQQQQQQLSIQLDNRASGSWSPGRRDVVVLIAAAGKAWLDSRGASVETGRLLCGNDQQASIYVPKDSSQTIKLFLVPSAELPQTRLSDLANSVLNQLAPKSLVIVDSYSPAAHGYHRRREEDGEADRVRYLHSSDFDAARIEKSWQPLEAPDTVIGVSAAFLSSAALRGVPVLLIQVPDKSPQSHNQLYGPGHGTRYSDQAAQVDEVSLRAIDGVIGVESSSRAESGSPSLVDFVGRRRPALPRGSMGDGGMYV